MDSNYSKSWVGKRVEVCANYDTRITWQGEIIQDDAEDTVVKLDDGRELSLTRVVDGKKYQYRPLSL